MGKTTAKSAPVIHYGQKVKLSKQPNKTGRKRRSRKLVSYLTVPEKNRLFGVIKSVRDRAIFRLLYHHGLRAAEIGLLDLSHFRAGTTLNLDRLYSRRLKGSVSGECAMVPQAALALRAWVRQRGYMEGPLFPSRQRGRITRCRIFQLMRKYCKAAAIPAEKSHPHIWKHSCATHLLSYQKESIVDVQKHLGHASIKNTMIYADLTGEANEARAKRLREWK
jgi:integrase